MIERLLDERYELLATTVTGQDADTGDDLVAETVAGEGWCYFEQRSAGESNVDRTQAAKSGFAVFPAGTVLDEASRVRIRGDVWSVAGPPDRVHRRGVEHHVETQLRLVT